MTARRTARHLATGALVTSLAIGAWIYQPSAVATDAGASPAPATGQSPPTAPEAPYTPTVYYLLSRMSIAEKIQMVHGGFGGGLVGGPTEADPKPNGAAGLVVGIPRLGIPTFRESDSNGVNAFVDTTAYPGRLGLAATFDRTAATRFGQAVGTEGLAVGMSLIYAPQVDLTRFPTWARNMTTYGEDPYLAAQMTANDVNAMQGTGMLAQVKHYGFYNGQNQNLPSIVGERAGYELYQKPFEAAVKDADVSSLMCSYAIYQLVGVESSPDYSCSNAAGLGLLRNQFGFKGWIGSDYGGSHATSDLLAGMDREFFTNSLAPAALTPLVDRKSPTYDPAYARALDTAVARILYQYQRFGRLDDSRYPAWAKTGVAPAPTASGSVDKAAGIKLSRTLAEQSGVLLKNDDSALPLSRAAGSSIAVVGPTADLMTSAPGGERSRGFGDRSTITPLDVLRQNSGAADVTYAPGIDRIGVTVPTTSLSTTADGSVSGLTRTTTDSSGNVLGTQVDPVVDGTQTDLAKGKTYTWTGYVDVPAGDTYTFWLQRPTGRFLGDADGPNQGINPGFQIGPYDGITDNTSISIDGATQTLSKVTTALQNNYPGGPTLNGQYLGLDSAGPTLQLAAGRHEVSIRYAPPTDTAAQPTFRFAWAALNKDLNAAVAAARNADTAVVFVDDGNTTTTAGNVGTLGPNQDKLIARVAAANPRTVVVMNTNAAVLMPWLGKVRSVLEMWYPGQEGGTATANLLYGDANPSGRLPITFPRNNKATPFGGHPERSVGVNGKIVWSEGLEMGYRWYLAHGVAPLFPFGFGLSYTDFTYSDLQVTPTTDGTKGKVAVSVRVTNTGSVAGATSPQVYVTLPAAAGEPSRRLVGFTRVSLKPGASRQVRMVIDPASTGRPLSYWNESDDTWSTLPGTYQVGVGQSASDLPVTAQFTVS